MRTNLEGQVYLLSTRMLPSNLRSPLRGNPVWSRFRDQATESKSNQEQRSNLWIPRIVIASVSAVKLFAIRQSSSSSRNAAMKFFLAVSDSSQHEVSNQIVQSASHKDDTTEQLQ